MRDFAVWKGAPGEKREWGSAKPGEPAVHEHGVLYQGPWETEHDGFCEHVRRCAVALAATGLPVKLRSKRPLRMDLLPATERDLREELKALLQTTIGRYDVHVQHLVPTEGLLQRTVSSQFYEPEQMEYLNAMRILYTVWERTQIPQYEADALAQVAQAWVACQANADMLQEAGVERVEVVPVPFMPDDPLLKFDGRQRVAGPVTFYNIGKWEPRKEQRQVLGAFLRAFRPGQARLKLKTSPRAPDCEGYPSSPERSVHDWMEDETVRANGWTLHNINRSVQLTKKYISAKQLLELHRIGDVYVSLSRGEGFDMPAFDAKLAGNLMVYTPSGGPQDFAGEHDAMVPPAGEITCHGWYNWGPESMYLDYELSDAVTALQRAYEDVLAGRRARGMDLEPFSAKQVGKRMRELIAQVDADRREG
jgi:hypothetical protein